VTCSRPSGLVGATARSGPAAPVRAAAVVFGRQPVPGRVKTRLGVSIGAEAAARVYAVLLEHALDVVLRAASAAGVAVVLSLAEPAEDGWRPVAGEAGLADLRIEVQPEGDLGTRLADCFERRFAEGVDQVVVVGSDCPGLGGWHLLEAGAALRSMPVVLGPAMDGGYWMIGQRRPGLDLFTSIPWSSPQTLEATRNRLTVLGAGWSELEALRDIDEVESLRAELAELGQRSKARGRQEAGHLVSRLAKAAGWSRSG